MELVTFFEIFLSPFIHSFSILSNDRSKASSKTIPITQIKTEQNTLFIARHVWLTLPNLLHVSEQLDFYQNVSCIKMNSLYKLKLANINKTFTLKDVLLMILTHSLPAI